MTTDEKLKAIIERVPSLDDSFTDEFISIMVINSYMGQLVKLGFASAGEYTMTPLGENVVAVCEEFDWKPSDAHLELFLDEMVEPSTKPAFRHFLKELRDNRIDFLEKAKKFMDKNKGTTE